MTGNSYVFACFSALGSFSRTLQNTGRENDRVNTQNDWTPKSYGYLIRDFPVVHFTLAPVSLDTRDASWYDSRQNAETL